MSGQNGYGNGYGYSGPGRYDANEGGYGGNDNLGVNGYSGRDPAPPGSAGRSERRPGGYGGFYDPPPPPALSPGQQPSPAPSQSPERRRDRTNRDWQQPSSQPSSHSSPHPSAHPSAPPSSHPSSHPSSQASSHPSSRSRTRNQEPDRKYREERSRDASRYADNKDQRQPRNASPASPMLTRTYDSGEPQPIESLSFTSAWHHPIANPDIVNSDLTVDPAGLGFHDRFRVCPGTCCFEFDGHQYVGQSRSRAGISANVR
jgi:exocyst complex component 4